MISGEFCSLLYEHRKREAIGKMRKKINISDLEIIRKMIRKMISKVFFANPGWGLDLNPY